MHTATMDQPQPLDKGLIAWGLFAVGLGLYLTLIGAGVVELEPTSIHGPLWIATCAGFAFALAGISLVIRAITRTTDSEVELPQAASWWLRFAYYIVGLAVVASLALIGSWIAFGEGERSFSATGPFFATGEASKAIGRIAFGAGAVITWLCLIALAISGARKLFGQTRI